MESSLIDDKDTDSRVTPGSGRIGAGEGEEG